MSIVYFLRTCSKYAGLFVLPDHSKNRPMSFTPAGFLLHLRIFLFPLKIEEEADIQHDAHSGRSGRGQTGHGQAGVGLDAHDVSHRQADPKGPCTMTQTVDEGAERQKRNLRQKLLQLQGQSRHLPIHPLHPGRLSGRSGVGGDSAAHQVCQPL